MCISASVSYSAAGILISTGLYAVRQARHLPPAYWSWALTPFFFGIQQAFEGRVWQMLDANNANGAVPFALGFHFFSHFLWLWWIPLSCYRIEPDTEKNARKMIMAGWTLFGGFAGSLVYTVMLLHPEWMSVSAREHSIYYEFSVPWRSPIHLPITPAALYALTILVPLFISSHKLVRIFGLLLSLSMVLASVAYGYAYVSVWCFFAAVLSLYIVYMIRHFAKGFQLPGLEP